MKEFIGFSFVVISDTGSVHRIKIDHVKDEDYIININGDKKLITDKLQDTLSIIRRELLKDD